MLPLAPALLSQTKVVLRRDCSSSASTRAIVSPVPLPPGAGTMSWIVLPGSGQAWASTGPATRREISASRAAKGGRRDIVAPEEEASAAILARRPAPCAPAEKRRAPRLGHGLHQARPHRPRRLAPLPRLHELRR